MWRGRYVEGRYVEGRCSYILVSKLYHWYPINY